MKELILNIIAQIVNYIAKLNNRFNPAVKLVFFANPFEMGRTRLLSLVPAGTFLGYKIWRYQSERYLQKEEFIAMTWAYQGQSFIAVSSLFEEYLTISEQEAALAHEIGHLKAGHLEGETGIMTNEIKEMEADDYVVSLHLGNNLKSGLTKLGVLLDSKFVQTYGLGEGIATASLLPRINRL